MSEITNTPNENHEFSMESALVMTGTYPEPEVESKLSHDQLVDAHYKLAKICYDKSNLSRAELNFEKALQYTQKPKDIFTVFKILGFLVRLNSEKMNSENAEKFIRASEDLIEEIPAHLGSLNAEYFYNVGVVHTYRGKFVEARNNFNLAFNKAKQENEPEIIGKALYSLATSHFQVKEFEQSLSYLDQLKELLQILNKTYMQGSMHLLYGNIFNELEDFERAFDHYRLANIALKKKTCWNLYGYILLGMGSAFKKKGEFNKAILYFDLAKNAVDEMQFRRLSQLIEREISDVNDSSVDLYLDRTNRSIFEKELGPIDFKHRFVLLEILFLLAQNAGTYYNKDELAKAIWKDEYNPLIHDKLIYTSISRLRKLIEPNTSKRKYILRGKDGYTFNPHVKARFQRCNDLEPNSAIGNIELNSPV